MIENVKSYFIKLERLSHDELDRAAQTLVKTKNTSVAKLIAHLAEMSSRKTALELGYKSLYDYANRRLNLSEGALPARIHVANVSRRFPQLLAALAESRISLTVACLLAPHLTEDNVEKLISDRAGMRRRKTEEYLVALKQSPFSSRRSASDRGKQSPVDPLQRRRHRRHQSLRPRTHRRALHPSCSRQLRKSTMFASRRHGIARTSSSDWPRSWALRTPRRTWQKSWRKRSTSRSTKRTRRRNSSGGGRGRRKPLSHLVQNEMERKTAAPRVATSPRRFPNGFTNVMATSVCILLRMGGGVHRAEDCPSTIGHLLASFTKTKSKFSDSYARPTIC